jgi:hypothetical protein
VGFPGVHAWGIVAEPLGEELDATERGLGGNLAYEPAAFRVKC